MQPAFEHVRKCPGPGEASRSKRRVGRRGVKTRIHSSGASGPFADSTTETTGRHATWHDHRH